MRYFTPYETLSEQMRDRLLLERSHSCACIKEGSDFVFTYQGIEAVRQRPDNALLVTIPQWTGIHWKQNFGFLYRQILQRHVPWRGRLEKHRKVVTLKPPPQFKSLDAFREFATLPSNRVTLLTTGQIAVDVDIRPHGTCKEVRVPDSAKPRLKLLTDEGKYQLKHRMDEMISMLLNDKALQALKGEAHVNRYRFHSNRLDARAYKGVFTGGEFDRGTTGYQCLLGLKTKEDLERLVKANKWWLAEQWRLPVTYEEVK